MFVRSYDEPTTTVEPEWRQRRRLERAARIWIVTARAKTDSTLTLPQPMVLRQRQVHARELARAA